MPSHIKVRIKDSNESYIFKNGESLDSITSILDLHVRNSKLNKEMSFAEKGPEKTENIKKVNQYFSDVLSGKITLDNLKRLNELNERMVAGDTDAGIELAMEFMPFGITKLLPIKGLKNPKERIKEAKGMGFFTDMPLYHGTNKDFEKFNLFEGEDPTRSVSRSPVGNLGVSLATDPKLANEFASRAGGEGMNVIPVLHRAKNPISIDLDGSESNEEIFATVSDAWKRGFDSIKFNNYTTKQGGSGQSFVLVKDPNQVRSVNAAFDPKKKMSPNLLAGATGATILADVATNEDEIN